MAENAMTTYWNPADPAYRANPYPFYAELVANSPVFVNSDGFVVLSRYDDVARTLRSADVSRDIESHIVIDPDDPIAVRRQQRSIAKTILTLDPPDHTRLRRLVSKAFTPRAIDALAGRVAAMTNEVLDQAEQDGQIEVIDQLAFPLPFNIISEMLGVPTDRSEELRQWSQALTNALELDADLADFDAAEAALWQLIPYLMGIVNERRSDPQDDMISALLAVKDDGDTLSGEELMSFLVLLYVAGHETTVNLIGNGLVALLRHPDQLERWRADPSLDAHGIDELLRFDPPVQHTVRVALRPIEYLTGDGEVVVAEPGQLLFCILAAANRDPAHFAEPDELLLDRPNAASHLSFGSGIHHCLGASLARLEATTAITSLIRRFPSIEFVGEPTWRDRITIRGVNQLRLKL